MSKMYIGNCTVQVQDFQYRLYGNNKTYKQMIPIGGQLPLSGDLDLKDIDFIVEQHAPYGLKAVSELDRSKDFTGLCYSIDKPINVDQLKKAIHLNHDVLVEQGKATREEAAVVVNNALEEQTKGMSGLQALDLTIQEVERKGEDTQINESIRVDRNAPEARQTGRGPRK